jgi:hypothetical protein
MYEQIQRTRAVAFNSSTECQDEQALMYTQALDMKDAVKKAINILVLLPPLADKILPDRPNRQYER